MEDKNEPGTEPVKPDLKHDTMEYAASTDGDDRLDADTESTQEIEDEEITAEELALLEEDDTDEQAAALNTAETDSLADEDNFLYETEPDESLDETDDADEQDENRR